MKTALSRDYKAIVPTVLEPDEALRLVDEILSESTCEDIDEYAVAEALFEMISRLSDTYSILKADQAKDVLEWTKKHWATHPIEYADVLCSILANLDIDEADEYILRQAEVEPEPVKGMLLEALHDKRR